MGKTSKFKKLGILIYPLTALMVGSSLGVGGYFIYKAIQKDKSSFPGYRKMGTPKTIWFNSGAINKGASAASKDWDFQIKVYPYDNGEYWLDDKGLELLRNELQTRLFHGQEIAMLDDIIIGNTNIIDENSNGLYFPLTKEIFLNVEQWKRENNISNENKIEGLMSTITHEYGHHIANMYLNVNYSYDAWDGGHSGMTPIHMAGDSPEPTNWNSEFTQKFYETLNYNSKDVKPINHSGYKQSVNTKLSLFDLFWKANGMKNVKWFDEDKYLFGIPVSKIGPAKTKDYYTYGLRGAHSEEYNSYRYTLDEIVTRQLGQLMHVFKFPRRERDFGHMIIGGHSGSMSGDSFILDTNTSAQIGINYNLRQKAYLEEFYKDYIFGQNGSSTSRAEEVYKTFTKAMGYGKLITNIYAHNKTYASVEKDTGTIYAKYNDGDLDQHKFKITGFAPANISGVYYGDEVDNQHFKAKYHESNLLRFNKIADRKKLWNFSRKDGVFGQPVKSADEKNNKWLPYVTTEYLNSHWNYNGKFKWWEDKNKDNKVDVGELISTKNVLSMDATNGINGIINETIPRSTFRQAWGEGTIYPKINTNAADDDFVLSRY